MIKVYGCSDDLLELDGAPYPADEIGCFDSKVQVRFSDGTLIEAGYPKEGKAIWWIKVLEKGTAPQTLTECDDEDAEIYSDVFEIDADYVWHEVSEAIAKIKEYEEKQTLQTRKSVMTLDEAIKHCEEVADSKCDECGTEHKQLAEWLRELKQMKGEEG